ncbi:GTPase HflX [Oceanicaulis sp. AH-315-P02]|nr:GTPase HflX [Robiginitomaculum sp.]MBN4047785.1 GTPase HflX [Oceanicaulis sp. AH-315-P02]
MIASKLDPQTAIIIHASIRGRSRVIDDDSALSEAIGLSLALGLSVSDAKVIRLKKIIPATFIGGGAILTLQEEIKQQNAGLLIFDGELTPVQQRNLEEKLQTKVLDRTGLILEIFSLRARTKEGQLQVELARIAYERSRLVRTWTHLERQRGGKGFLAGPGERQIESDRRELSDKAVVLRKQLEKVRLTRGLHRKARQKKNCPVIALVGYTNAGKSTLFNLLTDADVYVKDMLFATLDPTIRTIKLDNQFTAVLSDTVGFISNLPTELIAAFRATLEEVTEADLVLHVRDIASKNTEEQSRDVNGIMSMMQEQSGKMPPVIEIWNKIDLLDEEARTFLTAKALKKKEPAILISSETGEGVDILKQKLCDLLQQDHRQLKLIVPSSESQVLGWFQKNGRIISCDPSDAGDLSCVIRLDDLAYGKFCNVFPKLAAIAE